METFNKAKTYYVEKALISFLCIVFFSATKDNS